MAADLQPAGIGPDPVRVVDDRRGQPEHLALDLGQRVQAGGFLLKLGHAVHDNMSAARAQPGICHTTGSQ